MKAPRAGVALFTPLVASLIVCVPASAATTEIGAVSEIGAGVLPSGITGGGFAVQIAEASGTYAVPDGFGRISAWSHSTGTASGPVTFKVYRPTGAPQEFLVVASDTRSVTASTVHTFPVQIPVRPGDRIGVSAGTDDVQVAYESGNAADRIGFFNPDPPPGATQASDGEPFGEFKLDVAATLQSDASVSGGQPPTTNPPPGVTPPPTVAPPAAARLSVAPRSFAAARRGGSVLAAARRGAGATIRYSISVPAMVRFTVRQTRSGRRTGGGKTARCVATTRRNRRAARCKRSALLDGSFARPSRAATNSFRFSGRLRGRTLKPGGYTLVATPIANGRSGRPATSRFRIIR